MLSIIILNHNDTYHTINCLKSLHKQSYKNFEVILIENASELFYKKNLEVFLKTNELNDFFQNKIKIIYSNKNLGFQGGSNLGIKNSKGDLILLLNNDTIHETTFLEDMVNFFEKNQCIHIAQPKICFFFNKNLIWQNGGKIKKYSFNLFTPIDCGKVDNGILKKPFKIDYAIGCALFIRRSILKKIGLLEDIYFMYGDDSDLCYRATLKGYKNIFCIPKVKIYHNTKPKFSKLFKKYYFRSRMIFCFKFFSLPLIIWQFLMQFIQLIIYSQDLKKFKIDYDFFFSSIKGLLEGIKLGIRRRIQKSNQNISNLS